MKKMKFHHLQVQDFSSNFLAWKCQFQNSTTFQELQKSSKNITNSK